MLPAALLALALTSSAEKVPDQVAPEAALQAKELARRSAREYDLENYEDALRDIEHAYLLDPLPGLLFNLGQCDRQLKHWEKAETSFRNYLRYRPDAPNRATVLELIEEMRMEQEAAARARSSSAVAPVTPVAPAALVPTPVVAVHPVAQPAVQPAPPARVAPAPTVLIVPAPAPPPPLPPPSVAAPPPQVPPLVWAEDVPPPSKSHSLGWALVGTGAVAAVLAIVGAAEVANYQSISSNLASSEGTEAGYLSPSFSSLASQESQAQVWRAVGFVALGVAIASVPAVVLAW